MPRLDRIQAGIRQVLASRGKKKATRLPLTPAILERMRHHCMGLGRRRENWQLYWATSALCYFGFFRLGKLLLPTEAPSRALMRWGDVTFNHASQPTQLKIHLHVAKCDQFGEGTDVFIGKTGNTICPVDACLAYVAVRGASPGPFFRMRDSKPLLKPKFVSEVGKALSTLGLPACDYAGHSFRIGAATAAAAAGIEDSTIQLLGRWNSAATLTVAYMTGRCVHESRIHSSTLSQWECTCIYNGDAASNPSITVEHTASDPCSGAATKANPSIGAESTPTVDLPSTVVKSGPTSIATTVVEGPTIGANVGSTATKTTSSAIATGVRNAGTSNAPHRLSPLTK
eukprot:Em0024g419a